MFLKECCLLRTLNTLFLKYIISNIITILSHKVHITGFSPHFSCCRLELLCFGHRSQTCSCISDSSHQPEHNTTFKAPPSCWRVARVTSGNSGWRDVQPEITRRVRGSFPRRGRCAASPWQTWTVQVAFKTRALSEAVAVFARPATPSHQHDSFMLPALFSFLGESSRDPACAS